MEILDNSLDNSDEEGFILLSKFSSKIFESALKDNRKQDLLIEFLFKLLTTNDYLDLLSCIFYFLFHNNQDENIEDLKIIVSNVFIKILRQN